MNRFAAVLVGLVAASLALVALKAFGVIGLAWWLVLLPILALSVCAFVVLVAGYIAVRDEARNPDKDGRP